MDYIVCVIIDYYDVEVNLSLLVHGCTCEGMNTIMYLCGIMPHKPAFALSTDDFFWECLVADSDTTLPSLPS